MLWLHLFSCCWDIGVLGWFITGLNVFLFVRQLISSRILDLSTIRIFKESHCILLRQQNRSATKNLAH